MAIGDPFGSLDAQPDQPSMGDRVIYSDDIPPFVRQQLQQQEQDALQSSAPTPPGSSWYDIVNDVAHTPHRIISALMAPRASSAQDEENAATALQHPETAWMFPETFNSPVAQNIGDIVGGIVKNAVTAPRRVMTGELDPMSPEGTAAALDMASLGGASVAGSLSRAAASPGLDLRVFGKQLMADSAKAGAPVAIAEHAQPFYSGLEHAVSSIPQERMTGQQWLGTLANKPGVKPEELDWTGAKEMLAANSDRPVTKAQLQDHLDANKVQLGEITKRDVPWENLHGVSGSDSLADWYENLQENDNPDTPVYKRYLTPGGENYREKLLTFEPKQLESSAEIGSGDPYMSEHWEEPNVLGHLRMTDRNVREAPVTPEQYQAHQAAQDALDEHNSKLEQLRQQIAETAMAIQQESKAHQDALRERINADWKAKKISLSQALAALEKNYTPVESQHLPRLQQLRAQEDQLRRSAPPEPVDPELSGTPSLHVDEAQSDWHQQGRQDGYVGEREDRIAALVKEYNDLQDELKDVSDPTDPRFVRKRFIAGELYDPDHLGSVPHAPFKATPAWSTMLMKRALHEAATTGKTRISWSPGEFNATNPINLPGTNPTAASTIRADKGLRAFYDKMLVDQMNKIGKPHGVSVQRGFTEAGTSNGMSGERALKLLGLSPEHWENVKLEPKLRQELFDKARAQGQPVHYMDIPESLRQQLLTKGMPLFEDSAAAAPIAAVQHLGESNAGRGVGAGASGVEEAQRAAARLAGAVKPLEGLPTKPITVGGSAYVPGPNEAVHAVAKRYMESTGRPYQRADRYHPIDPEHATAIAKAYDEMKHAPNDPKVKASYAAMIKETKAQFQALRKSGLKIEAIKPGMPDPYAESPRLAHKDVAENNHLWFFPTETGFGKAAQAVGEHPLLQKTGIKLGGRELLANDLFRIVHDYFGHLKEGNGFRAAGEDNAWRTHALMYSDEARPAMTTETRGQNSWLNYGPYGETNRTASAADTHYADQKVGLLPDWVMRDRVQPHEIGRMAPDPHDMPHPGAKYPQYAETYPPVGPPQLSDKETGKPIAAKGKAAQNLVDKGAAYWAKQNTPEAEAFQKDRLAIQKKMDAEGYKPFFPPQERSHVDPSNHPTSLDMTRDALPNKQETIEKYRKMFDTQAARGRLQKAFDEGKKLGNAKDWYAMRQLEDQYVKHLGPEEGRKRFANEFAHTMAATTGGADPTSNLLLAHYVQWAARHGGIPEASHQLPFPLGGRYVAGNIKQFQKMPEEGGFTEANPKRHDFGHAFLGHANKSPIDEQMIGGLVPGMQVPPGDSYGVAAQVVHDLAKKNGVSPRYFQDIAWAGLKKIKVGDKFKYKGPMIQDVNDAIERTHRLTGMPRNEIVRRGLVRKEIPLYSNPVPLGALDAQEQSE